MLLQINYNLPELALRVSSNCFYKQKWTIVNRFDSL